jgi:hypothetical protein
MGNKRVINNLSAEIKNTVPTIHASTRTRILAGRQRSGRGQMYAADVHAVRRHGSGRFGNAVYQ